MRIFLNSSKVVRYNKYKKTIHAKDHPAFPNCAGGLHAVMSAV